MWKSCPVFFVFSLCIFSLKLFAGINVSEDLVHQYNLERGGEFSGQVTITNMGIEETMVKVEICDYRTGFNGQVDFDPPGSHDRSLAPWLTVGISSFVLGPGEQRIVPYGVSFSDEEKKPGSYWSALLISPEPRYNPTKQGMGLATIVRYAVIILGNIKGEIEASIRIPDQGIEETLDKRLAWFHIENNGDVVLRPKMILELINEDGEVAFVTPPSPDGFLFPRSSSRVLFNITNVPIGEFTGLLTVDAGEDRVFGAQYPFKIQSFNPYTVEGEAKIDELNQEEATEIDMIELTEQVRAHPEETDHGHELAMLYYNLNQDWNDLMFIISLPSEKLWWDLTLALENELDEWNNLC